MVQIAQQYFINLHTPEPNPPYRVVAKAALLSEVSDEYSPKSAPVDVPSGPFSLPEIMALKEKMPNMAPSPNGIHYAFWESLAEKVEDTDLPSFWSTFQDLTNDISLQGTNHCHFKNANISLFYKKGDPTLTKNYHPISSMNMDCKMYTNLINSCLAPWAIAKIHPDQKGFIPGRYITEHTHLATEVAHLSDTTSTNGYIISLDQAKAYDRTDLPWLLSVLLTMGIVESLVSLIRDVIFRCRSKVCINSGYSSAFALKCGV